MPNVRFSRTARGRTETDYAEETKFAPDTRLRRREAAGCVHFDIIQLFSLFQLYMSNYWKLSNKGFNLRNFLRIFF